MRSIWIILLMFALSAMAQNPIVPAGVYIADPAARVWPDGKLYIYGSLDESTDYYCSWRHHVLVTSDMMHWEIFPDRFASKGENDQVSYNNSLLFAPDCMYRNGTYYLYYCQPDPEHAEGVATSKSPTGPFVNGKPMNTNGYNQIDPAPFIDDDGQAYYVWGQFTLKMAKLESNMVEPDVSSIKDSVLTEGEHYFHEGAFMTKRNGLYYLVYADLSRANQPTCLGYATSIHPMGPYTYRGVIIDNDHCDPENWNNHGSIAVFKDQWYVFYHRATHASRMMRKACVEPIEFNADGSITEVEMTSQGAGSPLDATQEIKAERACLLFGNVRIDNFSPHEEALSGIGNNDRAAFKYLDFGNKVDSVTVRVRAQAPCKIDLAPDMPWTASIGTVDVPAGPDNHWQEITVPVQPLSGIHALWLRFSAGEGELFDVDKIVFK